MAATRHRLAARYRHLLRCYPPGYRRERGDEIVDTLLELAPPGRTRPGVRQAADLIRHGLRCRLGRPASRTVVLWAGLASVVWGLFGAAFAQRAAWETARPLPGVPAATAMFGRILPGQDLSGRVDRSPAMFVIYGQPLTVHNAHDLFFGDGGEYGFGAVSTSLDGPARPGAGPQDLVRRLRADGWQVSGLWTDAAVGCAGDDCDPDALPTRTYLTARRDADILDVDVYPTAVPGETYLSLTLQRATPWPVYPATLAGAALGASAAWLLFGWASRRTEYLTPALRGAAAASSAAALLLWWLPTVWAAPLTLAHHLHQPHPKWHPLWEWLGQPTASLPFCVGTAAGLVALAVAALPRRRTGAALDVATH